MNNSLLQQILVVDHDQATCGLIQHALGVSATYVPSCDMLSQFEDAGGIVGVFIDVCPANHVAALEQIPLLRQRWPYAPIIVLTENSSDENISRALICGANDFITKPLCAAEVKTRFHVRNAELMERISLEQFKFGDITVNTRLCAVQCGERMTHISSSNIELLSYLIKSRGTLVTRDVLRSKVWGHLKVSDSAVDKKVFEVRRALKDISSTLAIKVKYGEGLELVDRSS